MRYFMSISTISAVLFSTAAAIAGPCDMMSAEGTKLSIAVPDQPVAIFVAHGVGKKTDMIEGDPNGLAQPFMIWMENDVEIGISNDKGEKRTFTKHVEGSECIATEPEGRRFQTVSE